MNAHELIEILKDVEPNSPVSIVDTDQSYEFDIVETCTCDDDKNFLDILIKFDECMLFKKATKENLRLKKENEKLQEKIEKLKQQKKEVNSRYRIQQQADFTNRIHREETNLRTKKIIYQLCQKVIELSDDEQLLDNIKQIKKEFLSDRL